MAVVCDGCGSKKNVRRAWVTMWNGNVIDLCKKCYAPVGLMFDKITSGYDEKTIEKYLSA